LASRLRSALPWLGTVALLGYLAWTTDVDTVARAFGDVSLLGVLLVGLLGTAATFATDTWCVSLAFSRFVCPLAYREALPVKATSYFLNILNYNAALVGMAFYVKRSKDAPFWKSLGSLFLLNVADILALCVMLAFGLLLTVGSDTLDAATLGVAWLVVAGGLGGGFLGLALLRLDIPIPLLSRLLRSELLSALSRVTVPTLLLFVALRVLFLAQYLLAQYAFLKLFDIPVPLDRLLVYLPLLTFIQIIPISISGLGTVQLVMRHFFAPYVLVDAGHAFGVVDACSTAGIFAFLIFRVLLAYLFLGKLSREVIAKAGSVGREMDSQPENS